MNQTPQIDIVVEIKNRLVGVIRSMDEAIALVKRAAPTVTQSAVDVGTVRDEVSAEILQIRKVLDTLTIAISNLEAQDETLDEISSDLAQVAGELGEALSIAEPLRYDHRNLQTLMQNLAIWFERHPETIRQLFMVVDSQILEDQALEHYDLYAKLETITAHVAEQRYRRLK